MSLQSSTQLIMGYKMKNIILVNLFLLLFVACSSQTKNFTQHGSFVFDGGVMQEQKWDDHLLFDRITGYQEFTAAFDFAAYRVERNSPFFQWFSAEDKALIRTSAGPCYIGLFYTVDSKKISLGHLKDQLSKAGATFYSFRSFYDNLINHPKAPHYSYGQYTEVGMCFSGSVESLRLDFPGFTTVTIK